MKRPRLKHAELFGERVKLVPLDPRFADTAFDVLHENEDILRWLVWDGPACREEVADFYCRWIVPSGNGDDYHFAILDVETEAFAGSIGPRFAGHPTTGDVGYWLDPAYWGRGFMTEAVRMVTHLAFRYLDAAVMTAYVFVGNAGSRLVLERNGYRMAHLSKAKVMKGGVAVDEWYFTILRHEFERELGDYKPVREVVELE